MSNGVTPLVLRKSTPPPVPATAATTPGAATAPKKPEAPPGRVAGMRARVKTTSAKELIFRVLMVLLLAGSLGLVWYTNAKVLTPAQKRTRDLNTTLSRLGAEVDEMEHQWGKDDIGKLTTEFSEAQAQLISEQPQLENWLSTLRQEVLPLALDANARFGDSVLQATDPQKLALIPTTVSVQAQAAANVQGVESPYNRILRLTNNLLARETRGDLTQLTVTGGLGVPVKAELVLNLWAGEEQAAK